MPGKRERKREADRNRQALPEVKVARASISRAYRANPAVRRRRRANERARVQTPEGRASARARDERYKAKKRREREAEALTAFLDFYERLLLEPAEQIGRG